MMAEFDIVCFSHLRWDFVFQRPQQLLSRGARNRRLFYVEEPVFGADAPTLDVSNRDNGVTVIVPRLPDGLGADADTIIAKLLTPVIGDLTFKPYVLWFYNPMAIRQAEGLNPILVVYDCMDELSAFDGAHPELLAREQELFRRADIVFTGGRSLYESKRLQHPNTYCFPSSVDVPHFAQARTLSADPPDQSGVAHPRIGFFGVVDERFDRELLAVVADARPTYQFVILGPVVKIDPATLPIRQNIYYLGSKAYSELPQYIAGWDVAMMPFAKNESTRFISPTKTPEYLAAGRPVVSTSIRDVVSPYGDMGLVKIADTPEEFAAAIDSLLSGIDPEWATQVDKFLATMSWDKTWAAMNTLMENHIIECIAAQNTTTSVTEEELVNHV